MHLRRLPWIGFLIGVLFGTAGMWFLALVSLIVAPIETLAQPLFGFGRWAALLLARDGSVSDVGIAILFAFNGIFYGFVGALVQLLLRRMK